MIVFVRPPTSLSGSCNAAIVPLARSTQEVVMQVMQHWASLIVGKAEFDAPSANGGAARAVQSAARAEPQAASGELPERRAAALRGFFPKLASWLENATDRARRNEIEAYLSHATDIADLEERMRRLQQRAIYSHFC
jgi:hypothetical protein